MTDKDKNLDNIKETADEEYIPVSHLIEAEPEERYILTLATNKTTLTKALIGINVTIWLIMMGYSLLLHVDYNTVLDIFGAKENLSIMNGQYWRFLTPVFLHVSFVHLLINSYSLYYVGIITERIYGPVKFFVIYFAAGIFGNILSFAFSSNPGAGASGAIFGLLGALLYFGVENPVLFKRYFGKNVILTVVINIAYGFSQAGIDNYAHMGGLLGGFLTSGIVKLRGVSIKWLKRPVFIIITLLFLALSLTYGFSNNQNISIVKIKEMDDLNEKGLSAEAEKVGMEILAKNPKDDSAKLQALWGLIIAKTHQGNYDKAFDYADEMMKVDASRGHYMRGLLYFDTNQMEFAKKELEEAKKLDPALTKNVDKLLRSIQ